MNGDDVSVVVTTFQRSELAKMAIKSVFCQTLTPREIIVVEDAGDTDLAQWVANLNRDDLIYIRHDANKGLAAARNTGLQTAKCNLIAFLDDDDTWLPTRLVEQVERYRSLSIDQRKALAAIQVGCKIVNGSGKQISVSMPINQGNLRDSIMQHGAATPSSSFMFLRTPLLEVGGFDEKLISGIDHDIWMQLAVAGYSNEIIEKPLVVVTKDSHATMMSDTKRRVAGISQYVEKWEPTYKEWFGETEGELYAKRYFIGVIGGLAGQKFARNCFREGMYATKIALKCAKWRAALIIAVVSRVTRTYIANRFPQIGVAKRSLMQR